MAEIKAFVNGVWSPLCDIKYNKYINGQFEPFYTRPVTFYDSGGNPYELICQEAPEAPVLSSSALLSPINGTIGLNWGGIANATSYSVYNANTSSLIASGITGTSYTHTGRDTDVEYCYYVVAVNDIGNSSPSNTQCFTLYEVPNNVTIDNCEFRQSSPEGDNILINFTSASSSDPTVDQYRLWFRLVGDSANSYDPWSLPEIQHGADNTSYQFELSASNLIDGEEYYFVIQALGPGGSSEVNDTLACITFYSDSGVQES